MLLLLFAECLPGHKDLQTFPYLHPPLGCGCVLPPVVANWVPENRDPLWLDTHYTRQAAASLVWLQTKYLSINLLCSGINSWDGSCAL